MDASLSMTSVMNMDVPVTIKNTFLDVSIPEVTSFRRSSSLPRSWNPEPFRTCSSSCGNSVIGEDSTAASEEGSYMTPTSDYDSCSLCGKENSPGTRTPISELDCIDCDTDSMDNVSTVADDITTSTASEDLSISKPMIEVKLFDFVGSTPARTKLKATARPFASARAPPAGIQSVIAAAKDVLKSDPGVTGVQVTQGAMGGTWTMVANTHAPSRNPRYLLAMVKSALLSSAELSRDTYIMGYDVKPFTKIDKCSFTTTIATIPDSEQNTACWDTYKNGYCPRRMTCRWCHPSETQVIRLIIRVQKLFEPRGREAQAICDDEDE